MTELPDLDALALIRKPLKVTQHDGYVTVERLSERVRAALNSKPKLTLIPGGKP